MPALLRRPRTESDERLVARFRAGDDAAFAEIVARYEDRLRRYARQMLRRRSADVAEDVVQDAFLRAFGALRSNDRPMALRAWLYRIAHNRCLDELRVEATAELGDEAGPAAASTADLVESGERLRQLVADIDALAPKQRSALVIRELGGLTYEEIAEALDVTVPAVKSLLVRARVGLAEAAEARAVAERDALTSRPVPLPA